MVELWQTKRVMSILPAAPACASVQVMTRDVVKFPRRKPDWEEEKEFRARICNALLDAGYSATEAADLLLYAAYDLYRYSFQKAVAGFCVESAYSELECDEPGSIRLPYPRVIRRIAENGIKKPALEPTFRKGMMIFTNIRGHKVAYTICQAVSAGCYAPR
jgi:hypothetical protein